MCLTTPSVGKQSILPEVDGVLYEDKMAPPPGFIKRKILVGNRDLLINHDIAVPKQAYEEKYTRKGRKALYFGSGRQNHGHVYRQLFRQY